MVRTVHPILTVQEHNVHKLTTSFVNTKIFKMESHFKAVYAHAQRITRVHYFLFSYFFTYFEEVPLFTSHIHEYLIPVMVLFIYYSVVIPPLRKTRGLTELVLSFLPSVTSTFFFFATIGNIWLTLSQPTNLRPFQN